MSEIRLNCFRYLGMQSFDDVDYMLVSEYAMLMKAKALQRLDRERDIHQVAYLSMAVQATKPRGKKEVPVYQRFNDFFNYEKRKEEIIGIKKKTPDKNQGIKKLILLANKEGG